MSSVKTAKNASLATGDVSGYIVIDSASSLTRLNYFDGKFLRAPDLQLEQAALLNQVRLANQASGGGIVHGFDCTLTGGQNIRISNGLAYDWQGRALVLDHALELSLAQLIDSSRTTLSPEMRANKKVVDRATEFKECEFRAAPTGGVNVTDKDELYLILLSHIEAYCGEEDVYGKLCSEACISSTQRTHIVEGVRISAVPFALTQPRKLSNQVTLTNNHLRSRTVSAYFAQEQGSISSLISQQGLSANTWCLGAEALGGQGVPIGLLSKSGESIIFLDAWSVRRERMVPPPQQYWAARMGMRNWQIYLAQILQFQCQLRDCLGNVSQEDPVAAADPCANEKALINAAAKDMQQLLSYYTDVSAKLTQVNRLPLNIATLDAKALQDSIARLQAAGMRRASQQILIDCGIVELPSAGYLPVVPDSTLSINAQVRQLLGNGVDLRFCAVRPDYVHHALEEAQHMQRICLLSGLDNGANIQQVDILVPDGQVKQSQREQVQPGFQAHLDSSDTMLGMLLHMVGQAFSQSLDLNSVRDQMVIRTASMSRSFNMSSINVSEGKLDFGKVMTGSARADTLGTGRAFYLATENSNEMTIEGQTIKSDINFWAQMQADRDVFALSKGGRAQLSSRFIMETTLDYQGGNRNLKIDVVIELTISGQVIIEDIRKVDTTTKLAGRFVGDCVLQYTTTQDATPKTLVSSSSLNDDIRLSKTDTEHGPNVQIVIPSPAIFGDSDLAEMVYQQTFNSAGECEVLGYVELQTKGESQRQNFLSGKFVPDANVLKPGNAFYNKSLVALNQIAGALNNSGFVETASHLLFPPPVSVPDELSVKGTYPWVLFHRRRSKECEGASMPEVIAQERKYQIYYVQIAEGTDTEKLLARIELSFESLVADAQVVTEAVFAANSQVLNTAHSSLQQTWRRVVPANSQVLIAAIASAGEVLNEGAQIATARVKSANNVLDDVNAFAPNLPIFVKQTLPENLTKQGIDGAIVYFVQPRKVNTDCHAIYHVLTENPDEVAQQLKDAIEKYQSGAKNVTLDFIFNGERERKLDVKPHFVGDTGEYTSVQQETNLKNVWAEMGNYRITHAGAMHPTENTASAPSTRKQTESIVNTLGMVGTSPSDNMETIALPSGMLDDCQRASVLVSATQCHDVFLVGFAGRDGQLIEGQQVSDAERAALDVVLVEAKTGYGRNQVSYYRLNQIQAYWNVAQFVAGSQQSFVANWQSQLQGSSVLQDAIKNDRGVEFHSVVKPNVDQNGNTQHQPDSDIAKAQNQVLGHLMNIDNTQHYGLDGSRNTFPVNCPVITFVIVDPAPREVAITNDLASAVRFDDNNNVIRDAQLEAAMKEMADNSTRVSSIELVSESDAPASVKKAEAQARSLKKVLQETGISNQQAKVAARAPSIDEKSLQNRLTLAIK
jgi:hypothetical protein